VSASFSGKQLWRSLIARTKFTIVFDSSLDSFIAESLSTLETDLLQRSANREEQQRRHFTSLITARALSVILDDGRYFHFRRASNAECAAAQVPRTMFDKDDSKLEFHFFETYGYRFTMVLNLAKTSGKVYCLERFKTLSTRQPPTQALQLTYRRAVNG